MLTWNSGTRLTQNNLLCPFYNPLAWTAYLLSRCVYTAVAYLLPREYVYSAVAQQWTSLISVFRLSDVLSQYRIIGDNGPSGLSALQITETKESGQGSVSV
jgi:hypothetical protein